jgi:enoyl-CoA hydratase
MGFVSAGGTLVRLVRQIPYMLAMELMLTANRFSAQRLAERGVLNHVVSRTEVASVALAYAERISQMDAMVVRTIKQAVLSLTHLPFSEAFTEEVRLGQVTFTCPEAKDGLRRFIERKDGK